MMMRRSLLTFDDKRKKKADIPFKHFILNTLKEYCVYTFKTQSNSHQIQPLISGKDNIKILRRQRSSVRYH